jgi:hypothetical protein
MRPAITQKTDHLADLIQEWLDHDEETTRARKQMDDINKRMDDLQKKIDAARAGCPGAGSALLRIPGIQLARYTADQNAGAGDPTAIAASLRASSQQLSTVPTQFGAALPWLYPFLLDTKSGISRRLLSDMVGEALPHLEAIQKAIDDAVAQGKSMEGDLGQAIPAKSNTPKPPPKS